MVVVAHADDAEYGCSGTVAKWCSEGWEIVYVICTDGSKGSTDRNMTQQELSGIRRREQINAGKVLGLKETVFLDYEDSMLQPTLELRRDISREIRRHRPDVLICTSPVRNLDSMRGAGHPDHLAAGEAALAAVFPAARDHMTFPELLKDGLEPHKVAEVWVMAYREADHWVDVTGHMDTSIKALSQHVSQLGGRSAEEIGESMRKGRSKTGADKGMQYAEGFKRIVYGRRDQTVTTPAEGSVNSKE
jgi:LmbE family N-acetylglucosaminyl deacetylase